MAEWQQATGTTTNWVKSLAKGAKKVVKSQTERQVTAAGHRHCGTRPGLAGRPVVG